jgi:RNA polymerase sigma-32 factor
MSKSNKNSRELQLNDAESESDISSQESEEMNLPVGTQSGSLTLYKGDIDSTDPFHQYLKEISKYPLLSIEQEQELIKSLKDTGDIEVAKKLVVSNLRLVVKIAMEYRSTWQNLMDLIQEGNIGLMKAVSKYDDSKGAKLSYYASWWIKSFILKFILDNFRMVKIGTTNEQKKLFYNLMKEKNRLISMGITPDQKNISESLGVSEKAVVLMDQRLNHGGEVSLDAPLRSGNDSTGSTLGEIIADDKSASVEDGIAASQEVELLQSHLSGFMDTLKDRDKEIFKNRLLNEAPMSLQEIGDLYGVSRERIRQIEARLLGKLKVYMSEFIR